MGITLYLNEKFCMCWFRFQSLNQTLLIKEKHLCVLRKVDILNKTVNYSAAQQSIQHLSQYCLVDIYKYWPVKSFGTRESR